MQQLKGDTTTETGDTTATRYYSRQFKRSLPFPVQETVLQPLKAVFSLVSINSYMKIAKELVLMLDRSSHPKRTEDRL
jgi:hypothetical protein